MTDISSDQAFDAIESIAKTASKTEKESMVKSMLLFPTFKRVCVAAYDVRTTYGMDKVPEKDPKFAPGETLFIDPVWQMLDALAKRTLTGNAAKEEVSKWMQLLSPKSAELLKRIIKKDLRAGFTGGTVNRVAPGTVREEPPYMRCTLVKDVDLSTWPWADGVFSQEKMDGQFVNVDHETTGEVVITTRGGNPYPAALMKELNQAIRVTLEAGTQSHGELLVTGPNGELYAREVSNGKLNSLMQGGALEGGDKLVIYLWDQIPLGSAIPKGKSGTPYRSRFKDLLLQLKTQPAGGPLRMVPTKIVKSLEEAMAHYRELLAQGKEGTIIAHPNGIWKDGTSKDKVKLKLQVDVDLKPVRFEAGTGKNAATFGAIVCQTSDGLLEVAVGGGYTDKVRKELNEKRDEVLNSIMVVRANSIMAPSEEGKPYSLFLPRHVELRTDKREADSLPRVKEQFESAVRA